MLQFSGYRKKDDLLANIEPYHRAKRIAHNTFEIHHEGGDRVIRYSDTNVLTFTLDGKVTLNSGGFRTPTTKSRMNDHLPSGLSVYQQKSVWYVRIGGWQDGRNVLYYDGMQFDADLRLLTGERDTDKHVNRVEAMKKRIEKFIRKLDKMESIPMPSGADCWDCAMRAVSGPDKGKSWGDVKEDSKHLLLHVTEGYMHGSLIYNALADAGYREPGYIVQMGHRDMIKRALRRYLRARLLPS